MPTGIPYISIVSSKCKIEDFEAWPWEKAVKEYNDEALANCPEVFSPGSILNWSDGLVPFTSQSMKYAGLNANTEETIKWINSANISDIILNVGHSASKEQPSAIMEAIGRITGQKIDSKITESSLVNLYESYIKQQPSSITNNSVPTKKEVIKYMETYIKGGSISKPPVICHVSR